MIWTYPKLVTVQSVYNTVSFVHLCLGTGHTYSVSLVQLPLMLSYYTCQIATVCSDNGPSQDHGGVLPVCSSNGPFQDHGGVQPACSGNGPFQDHGGSQPVCPDNGPFQGNHVKHVTNTVISPTGRANYINLVHWNAQEAISKTSAIKTAIAHDDIDIVMIPDTRYKRRLDDLPNLRIQGHHSYHRTMEEGGQWLGNIDKTRNTNRGSGASTLMRWH